MPEGQNWIGAPALGSWAAAIMVPVAVAAALAGWLLSPGPDVATRLEEAASRLGITEALRSERREALRAAIADFEEEPCDEGLRERAGKAVVAYYETLLERPIIEAGLIMTYEARCEPRKDGRLKVVDAMMPRRGINGMLGLPWACLPAGWRTPADWALQTKLERSIFSGQLPSHVLTGTLAIVAKPTLAEGAAAACRKPQYHSPPRQLPVLPAPQDDWDRQPRRSRSQRSF